MTDAPSAAGTLPAIAEIQHAFEVLEDWDDRFAYLIDLGRKRPAFPADAKIEPNRVHGCQSTVHLRVDVVDDAAGAARLSVRAESDAAMVNGLIAVMIALFDGLEPATARDIDARAVVSGLGLDEHLSQGRKNGLAAMIERIETLTQHV